MERRVQAVSDVEHLDGGLQHGLLPHRIRGAPLPGDQHLPDDSLCGHQAPVATVAVQPGQLLRPLHPTFVIVIRPFVPNWKRNEIN